MPGTITRDAGKSLITITGGTVAAPVTFADVIAAATAGGWPSVTAVGDSILITDHVAFGTIAATVNFADTRKTVQVGLPGARRGLMLGFPGGSVRFGEKINGRGVNGCKLCLYLDNNSASAAAAFAGIGYSGQVYTSQFYGSNLDLYYTGTGFSEFIVSGPCDWLDTLVSANGTVYFADGATGTVKRVSPNYQAGAHGFYQYSANVVMDDVPLGNTSGIVSGGGTPTFSNLDFGSKTLGRFYNARVTCNDCTLPDAQIASTDPNGPGPWWVKKNYTHSVQTVLDGAPLSGAKVRVSSGGVQDYAGQTNASGTVDGGLVLSKQFDWTIGNALSVIDRSNKLLRIRKYGLKFVEQTVVVAAKGTTVVPLQPETIALSPQAAVAAMGQVSTLKQLYEVSRHYGEADTSLPDPVSLAGGVLDFGAYDVVLSTGAAAVWAVVGNTVTVKCAASVASAPDAASIKTTGTVTLTGVTAGFGVVDSTGDSYLKFEGIDSWIVYSDASRTVQLGAGTGSKLFRFVYSSGVTYYLKCVTGSTEFSMVSTPVAAGNTEVTLSTQALLTALQGKVADVKADTGFIKLLSM